MSLLYSEVILFYNEQTQAFVLRGRDRVDITQCDDHLSPVFRALII